MGNASHLSIAIAGKRRHDNLPQVAEKIPDLFTALHSSAQLYLNPLSGLADGADMIAAQVLLDWMQQTNNTAMLTGVFPFKPEDYRKTITNKKQFEKLVAACNRRIFLDGRYQPGDEPNAKKSRAEAYRQQAQYLLASGGVLQAIADEDQEGKAGGTRETMELAMDQGLPVIFLSLHNLEYYLLTSPDQAPTSLAGCKAAAPKA